MFECTGCGNHLHPEQPVCPYCGTRNPVYKASKTTVVVEKVTEKVEKANLNVCLLIFLVIVFWPAAIIYAVVKMNQSK